MGFYLKLIMPSDPRILPIVRAAVRELGGVFGLSEESAHGVTLAIDEGLANVIRHAYKNCYEEEIEFACQVDAGQMVFTLLDKGEPPDPARICAQPLDDASHGGRGTHLMKAIMDEMHYEQVPRGNQLRLVKHLPGTD